MLDLVVQLLGLGQALFSHFFTSSVILSTDYSGEWSVNLGGGMTPKGHALTGALSSVLDYGTVILAQLLAVIAAGAGVAGNYGGNNTVFSSFNF